MTLDLIFSLKSQTQLEEGHKDPPTLPTANCKDLPKTKETIEEYIRAFRGVEKSSLGYVIHEDIFPPAAITNPVWGTAGSRYDSIDNKLIARMRIINADLQNPVISADYYKVKGHLQTATSRIGRVSGTSWLQSSAQRRHGL